MFHVTQGSHVKYTCCHCFGILVTRFHWCKHCFTYIYYIDEVLSQKMSHQQQRMQFPLLSQVTLNKQKQPCMFHVTQGSHGKFTWCHCCSILVTRFHWCKHCITYIYNIDEVLSQKMPHQQQRMQFPWLSRVTLNKQKQPYMFRVTQGRHGKYTIPAVTVAAFLWQDFIDVNIALLTYNTLMKCFHKRYHINNCVWTVHCFLGWP